LLLLCFIFTFAVIPILTTNYPTSSSTNKLVSDATDNTEGDQYLNDSITYEPLGWFAPADTLEYVYYWNDINGYGSVNDFINILDSDSDYAQLIEEDMDELIGVNYGFDRVFQFYGEAWRYQDCELETRGYDYTGVSGYYHEPIKFYYSESFLGPWTELGEMASESSTSYSWTSSISEPPSSLLAVQVN